MVVVTPYREAPVLDLATLHAAAAAQRAALVAGSPHCTREQIAARAAVCRPCPYTASGSATCPTCDLRCAHPLAEPGRQLLAMLDSTCPANLWPNIPQ